MPTNRINQEDYHVALDAFHGPLDLLLFLIRRAEVDIADIPIAKVTDQYLAFLQQIEDVDIELAGEFLVMAATLIEIKSRMLRPRDEQSTDSESDEVGDGMSDAGDPRYELVQQLLAYQRYRIASEELERLRGEFAERWPNMPSREIRKQAEQAQTAPELDLEEAHPLDLFDAYERILATIDFNRLGEHSIEFDDTPIELYEEDLLDRLQSAPNQRMTLQQAFEGRNRSEVIGLFLATLELVRQRLVLVQQERGSDDISLALNTDAEDDGVLDIDIHVRGSFSVEPKPHPTSS